MTSTQPGRLAGKIALVTGGTGNIGEVITRRFLAEGASVAITGRKHEKLTSYLRRLMDEEGVPAERVLLVRMDGSKIEEVRAGVAEILERLGRIDVLVNTAGSAGPRRALADIPLTADELQAPDTESLQDTLGSLVGITWNLTRAVAPHMAPGSSIINVSTIFSRTEYYGSIPYVVPKAAVNALGDGLARELGGRGIRLNTIYPGPMENERSRAPKGAAEGNGAAEFPGTMRLNRPDEAGAPVKRFPNPLDVANAAVFLASDESAAFAGHAFEVTHGMDVPAESRTTFASRPGLRAVDASGMVILICAGDQAEDALDIADVLRACRATLAIGFRDPDALHRAEELLRSTGRPASADMYGRQTDAPPPLLVLLDPLDPAGAMEALNSVRETLGAPQHALVLPAKGVAVPADKAEQAAAPLADADDASVQQLLRDELGGAVAVARLLARFWNESSGDFQHRVLFMTNQDDGCGNRFAAILRAGVEQLCRAWRHEGELGSAKAAAARAASADVNAEPAAPLPRAQARVWSNQLVRYTSGEPAARDFAAGWAARLLGSAKLVDEINLYLPDRLAGSIGIHTRGFGFSESLFGMHMGKVALITGGSAGIGGQIGRLLAISGARVMLAARRADELERTRAQIVREVRDGGYLDAERRVEVLADCDVSDESSWSRLVEHTLAKFGRVDYLINNAGIAGAEEMVIDMPHDAWRHTIKANLLSNYALIRLLAPAMKQTGGYIVNVSSYFGGEKHVAIPYPNRSDYAVSKAGQRALAEALARFMGPQVQINALAPGPVEGDRLKGTGERPGLFARRARLILENRRLNDVHAALVVAHRESGIPVGDLLPALASNDVEALAASDAPAPLRRLATQILEGTEANSPARAFLVNANIARKLARRLAVGGHLPGLKKEETPEISIACADVPAPFFAQAQIDREAAKVSHGILGMLDLGRMPTEFDVALATVFYLVDRNVTGETFHPSGGLNFERTVTEGELFGKPGKERLEKLAGSTVFLIGEHMHPHLTALARSFLDEQEAAKVVFITETAESAKALTAAVAEHEQSGRAVALVAGADLEGAIDRACAEHGKPGPVVSTPFRPLPQTRLAASRPDWSDVLTTEEFTDLVEYQITHHFRVAQKASLIDGANLTLVTPPTSARSTAEEFALANFVKPTLHAFTATLGAESERTVHHVPVNQVDLTRRSRNEEPQNEREEEEEMARFVTAVLLTSAPLPTPRESRYRSRIYRGKSITV
jgi:malonyl-CoA reductase/3-hydroxypropionate dehydrogenase (NADP+)